MGSGEFLDLQPLADICAASGFSMIQVRVEVGVRGGVCVGMRCWPVPFCLYSRATPVCLLWWERILY